MPRLTFIPDDLTGFFGSDRGKRPTKSVEGFFFRDWVGVDLAAPVAPSFGFSHPGPLSVGSFHGRFRVIFRSEEGFVGLAGFGEPLRDRFDFAGKLADEGFNVGFREPRVLARFSEAFERTERLERGFARAEEGRLGRFPGERSFAFERFFDTGFRGRRHRPRFDRCQTWRAT